MPTKRDERLAQQENLKETFKIDDKTYHAKKYLTWGILGALVLAGLVVFFVKAADQPLKFDVTQACLRGAGAYHIHPQLTILIDGQSTFPPANVGVSTVCMRSFHTHESDGVIHTEPPKLMDLTLGQFFRVWDKEFNKNQVLDYKRSEKAELTMTVDGQPSEAWENLVLKDQQKIVINYRTKTP